MSPENIGQVAESPFLSLAERDGLDYAERVAPGAQGTFPLPHGETSELIGGSLPGGYEGVAARLRRNVDQSEEPVELTLIATRIPESVEFARYITCFEAGFRGVISRAIGAGGLGWIREFTFESIEFNRRYLVAMLRTGNESRLRQLFSPTFLDWMADTAPEGLYFDLVSGVLTVTLAGTSVTDVSSVERACELAGRIAARIRSEALEGASLDDGEDPDAAAGRAAYEERYAQQIQRAGFRSPPHDVASALDRLGPAIKAEKGFLGRMFGSRDSPEATMVALATVLRGYADRIGLEPRYPDALHELLPFFDHFPMAVMRLLSLRGSLPSSTASGELVALLDLRGLGSPEGRAWPTFELEIATAGDTFVHVLDRSEREGAAAPSAVGGFSLALGDGARHESEATRRRGDDGRALAEALGGGFDVVADRRAPRLDDAGRAWLANGGGGLVFEGGTLTLLGAPRPVIEWSFDALDEFSNGSLRLSTRPWG